MPPCKNCRKFVSDVHRRAQKAEGENIRLRKQIEALPKRSNPWGSFDRMAEALEREAVAEIIELSSSSRVEQTPYKGQVGGFKSPLDNQ
jgi:hypothetical protein